MTTENEKAGRIRCEPPFEHADKRWHWIRYTGTGYALPARWRSGTGWEVPGVDHTMSVDSGSFVYIRPCDDPGDEKVSTPALCCAPADGTADNSWHWLDVPGPTGRRTGCFEWMGGHWWPNGRQVTPELAAASGWRYVRAATEQPVPEPEPEKPARCVPPNLPLQTGMHLLQIGGRQIKARWHGIAETWLIAEGFGDGSLTPEEVAAKGFTYVAALPGEPSAHEGQADQPTRPERMWSIDETGESCLLYDGKHALLAPAGGIGRTLAVSIADLLNTARIEPIW